MFSKVSTKNNKRFFFLILVSLFSLINSYTAFAGFINFGTAEGGVAYNPEDFSIQWRDKNPIPSDFLGNNEKFIVISEDIKAILKLS